MSFSNKWLNEAAQLCVDVGPEDGIDPRFLSHGNARKKDHHKTQQLCKEVKKVISLVLAGELQNPLLQALQVLEVTAEGEGQFLHITVATSELAASITEEKVLSALIKVQGYLRTSIAQSVKRKRVPALKFSYAGKIAQR